MPDDRWFGHPRGLSTLFFTEMWERFSYYGMRAILVLFMTNAVATGGMGMDDVTATAIYGLYTAAVYVVALPGGWIADRLLGLRRAVFWGGVVIAAGHFTLAIPSIVTFYLGLMLIVIGTGLLKPNVSAMVGDLYPEGGARRDAGFSIYYMGINVGGFFGPLICGYLGETIDWHLGFGAAGVGMVLGLMQYSIGGKHLGTAGELKAETKSPAARAAARRSLLLGLQAAIGGALIAGVLHSIGAIQMTLVGVVDSTGVFIVALAAVFLLYVAFFGGLTIAERKRVGVIAVCFAAAACFWSGFEQAGSSMNLFAERLTNRVIGGWEMPASWLQSVNSTFIILLAPMFSALWLWLGARNPSIPAKMGFGLLFLGVGFAVLAWASMSATPENPVSPVWLVATYFFHTVGELCLSPIGLSAITKLSPHRYVGQMMGIWFMGAALGNLVAGRVAGLIASLPLPQLFGAVTLFALGTGLLLLAFTKPLKKWIGGVLVALLAVSCRSGLSTAPNIVQPGAPGEPSRVIDARKASDLSLLLYTGAEIRFMEGMIVHHAQALEMTALLSSRTSNEDIRMLAKRIELSQADEIRMMSDWLKVQGVSLLDPDAHHHHDATLMPGMLTGGELRRLAEAKGDDFDRLFLEFMIKHHEGALVMVDELFAAAGAGQQSDVFAFASDVDADQRMEIDRMGAMLKERQR
jgi:POT family proton-dependent oligopeptide transporter